jgi:hypothetical protein
MKMRRHLHPLASVMRSNKVMVVLVMAVNLVFFVYFRGSTFPIANEELALAPSLLRSEPAHITQANGDIELLVPETVADADVPNPGMNSARVLSSCTQEKAHPIKTSSFWFFFGFFIKRTGCSFGKAFALAFFFF